MHRPDAIPSHFQNIRNQESRNFITVHYKHIFLMTSHNNLLLFIQEAGAFSVQSLYGENLYRTRGEHVAGKTFSHKSRANGAEMNVSAPYSSFPFRNTLTARGCLHARVPETWTFG
jgi:hypothetical protein